MAYTPAGNLTTTGSLTHLATVYYERKALDQLMVMFQFMQVCEDDIIPRRNGKTVQFYRYALFGANTTPASEGAIGTSLTLSTSTISATVSEFSDFVSMSTLLQDTAIDDIAVNAAEDLGYRAGLSVDTIVRTELDSITSPELSTVAANGSIQDFRQAVALLLGANVRPRTGMDFTGVIHPYVLYDVASDNTAGGFIDVMRYANPNTFITGQTSPNEIGKVEGVRLFKTTNVKTSGTAPNVLYYTYVVGKGAIGAVSLAGNGPQKVKDPTSQRFQVNMIPGGKATIYDPTGTIGAIASYRFVFTAKLLDTVTPRYKMIKMDSSLI